MSKYLVSVTEVYRVDSENEVEEVIETAKDISTAKPPKYNPEYKERKQKGEIVDAWWKVTVTNYFNDEKEPMSSMSVSYDKGSAF